MPRTCLGLAKVLPEIDTESLVSNLPDSALLAHVDAG